MNQSAGRNAIGLFPRIVAFASFLCGVTAFAAEPGNNDDPFKTAIAVWHLADLKDSAGKSDLTPVGPAHAGIALEGADLQHSLSTGDDGKIAQIETGGYLDAGQGADGVLNVKGAALTVSVRLRSPSGHWDAPLFSKHGGHDRLVYNLYSTPTEISFELGTRDTPGCTRVTVPLPDDRRDRLARHRLPLRRHEAPDVRRRRR